MRLQQENRAFAGTGGVSANNRCQAFQAAFQDTATGAVELARFANGKVAPVHVFEGLPEGWVAERGNNGLPLALKGTVIAGFVRSDRFYTREEAAALL
jgi:hypothetical protein